MEMITVWAGITVAVVPTRPSSVTSRVMTGQLEDRAQSLGRLFFLAKGQRFLDIDQGHLVRPQTVGLGRPRHSRHCRPR